MKTDRCSTAVGWKLLLQRLRRTLPWALLVGAVAAAGVHVYGATLARDLERARADLERHTATTRVEEQRVRRLLSGRTLLERARQEGLDADQFRLRSVSYHNVTLPANEANVVLDRTLKGGADSLMAVQDFRLAAGRPGQALWGAEGLTEQDAVVITLVGDQYFRVSRP